MMPSAASKLVIGLSTAVYLGLALGGIRYGLPDKDHLLSYNCDETQWLDYLSMAAKEGRHFRAHPAIKQPTFYMELYGAALLAARQMGYLSRNTNKDWLREHREFFARYYLVGRYLQVLAGIILLLSTWAMARLQFGEPIANMATALLAVTPSLIGTSHFSQGSLPVAALAALCLLCLHLDQRSDGRDLRWLLTASFVYGLSVTTKYSAIPLLLPLIYQTFRYSFSIRRLSLVCMGTAGGLFIGDPFLFLTPQAALAAFMYHAADNLAPLSGKDMFYPLLYPARFAMGLGLESLSAIAVGWALFYKPQRPVLLLLWIAGFCVSAQIAGQTVTVARLLIVIPSLLILVFRMLRHLKGQFHWPAPAWRVGLALLFLFTGLRSAGLVRLRYREPIQKQSSDWIRANIPAGKLIGIPSMIFWWTPDIVYQCVLHPERTHPPYSVVQLDFSKAKTERVRPDYIIVSNRERIVRADLAGAQGREFLDALDDGQTYRLVKFFPRDVHWGPLRWNRPEIRLHDAFDDDLWLSSLSIYQRIQN